jgi:hypothetical protein
MEKFDDSRSQELLAEELTEEEVRELLVRLQTDDLGGSENATVAAVVEATGASLGTVSDLLAKIRREAYHELFGAQLDDHEHRITKLEGRPDNNPAQPPAVETPPVQTRPRQAPFYPRVIEWPVVKAEAETPTPEAPVPRPRFPQEEVDGRFLEESVSPLAEDPRFGDDGKPIAILIILAFIAAPLAVYIVNLIYRILGFGH